ncbi:hypothetical protein RR46_00417 [Papilio xuthus]|uniref:Uncharacterized protein n=1 Tax=Papilio xuthus TaxID=66420 RepID=A0A0N0P9H7_PAPXU|nr:hypothetical protein RR46_00417 [Papilio xuthus]
MLYLNTSIRGYPRGLRAGSDPRKPLLCVNDDFDSFTFQGVPYTIQAIEVFYYLLSDIIIKNNLT